MASETPLEGDSTWKAVKYERTPVMSTYLLAFVVGEYDYVEDKDADGVLIRVYTPVGKKEQGRFALEVRGDKKTMRIRNCAVSGFNEENTGQLWR